MDGVGTPIIGRPRPLPRHDTPNPAYHPHTLNYEEPVLASLLIYFVTFLVALSIGVKIYIDSTPGALPMSLWNVSLYAASGLFLIVYAKDRSSMF